MHAWCILYKCSVNALSFAKPHCCCCRLSGPGSAAKNVGGHDKSALDDRSLVNWQAHHFIKYEFKVGEAVGNNILRCALQPNTAFAGREGSKIHGKLQSMVLVRTAS